MWSSVADIDHFSDPGHTKDISKCYFARHDSKQTFGWDFWIEQKTLTGVWVCWVVGHYV